MIFLLTKGVDINAKDCDGKTPLHYSTRFPSAERTAHWLIARGANINIEDNEGKTALQSYSNFYYRGDVRRFKELLKLIVKMKSRVKIVNESDLGFIFEASIRKETNESQ